MLSYLLSERKLKLNHLIAWLIYMNVNSAGVNLLGCQTSSCLWVTRKPLTHPVSQESIDSSWITGSTSCITGYPLKHPKLQEFHFQGHHPYQCHIASKHIHLIAQSGAEAILPTWLSAQHKTLNITSKRKIKGSFLSRQLMLFFTGIHNVYNTILQY